MPHLDIIRHTTNRHRHARRGQAALPVGSTLYLIQDRDSQKYFSWGYLDGEFAKRIRDRLLAEWRPTDLDFNFVPTTDRVLHTARRDFI